MSRTNWATQEMFNWAANDPSEGPYNLMIALAEEHKDGTRSFRDYAEEIESICRNSPLMESARDSIVGEGDSLDDVNYDEVANDFLEW